MAVQMNQAEQARKEQWIKQIWEEAKEVARPDRNANIYNANSTHNSGSMDAGFEQALEDEMAAQYSGNH